MEADEEEEPDLFRHHYGALWFAHETAKEYDKQRKTAAKGESSHIASVINNGKWYFTAVLVQMLGELTAEVVHQQTDPGWKWKQHWLHRRRGLFRSIMSSAGETRSEPSASIFMGIIPA